MATSTLANINPIIPETSSFWNHTMHLNDDRYGGLTTHNSEYYTCEVFYKSTISSDTKFWVRGGSGQFLTSFEETQNFNRNSNFNMHGGNPTVVGPCSNCIVGAGVTIEDGVEITWDNISHGTHFWAINNTKDYSTVDGVDYSGSKFTYQNGVLTKGIYNEVSEKSPISYPEAYLHSLLDTFAYVTDNTHTGSATNWYVTSSSGVGNDWQPAGIHTYTEAFTQAINQFVPQLSASVVSPTEIHIDTIVCDNDNGSIEQIYLIDLYSSASSGISSASNVGTAHGYVTNSFNDQYMYHSYLVYEELWNNGATHFINFDSILPQNMFNMDNYTITTSAPQVSSLDITCDVDYKTPIGMLSSTTNEVWSEGNKVPMYMKFKTGGHVIKQPTCACVPLNKWFNIPRQKELGTYYRLTFNDGYSFVAGPLLRLFTYNPLYPSATQSYANCPDSGNWPHSLTSVTPAEIATNPTAYTTGQSKAFIKCADLIPGTTQQAGHLYLTNIQSLTDLDFNSSNVNDYDWNPLNNDYHFNINNDNPTCWTDKHHILFPHFTRVNTNFIYEPTGSNWDDDLFEGCLMIENGLYVAFENYNQPPRPVITFDTINMVSCYEMDNGSIAISVESGSLPYTYLWSNGATTQDISYLAPGTYSVTVTDANGMSTTSDGQLITEPVVLDFTFTKTNVSCYNGSDGAIDITVTGGTAPFTHSWSNGATTEDVTSLSAGSYTLTVTDINGCIRVRTIEISEPAELALSMSIRQPHTHVDTSLPYYRANIAASMSVEGGVAPYTYSWEMGWNGPSSGVPDWEALCTQSYSDLLLNGNACVGNDSPFNYPQNDLWTGSTDNYSTAYQVNGIRLHTNNNSNHLRCTVTDNNGCSAVITGSWSTPGINISGCTSSNATNYNFFANIDDGSCTY